LADGSTNSRSWNLAKNYVYSSLDKGGILGDIGLNIDDRNVLFNVVDFALSAGPNALKGAPNLDDLVYRNIIRGREKVDLPAKVLEDINARASDILNLEAIIQHQTGSNIKKHMSTPIGNTYTETVQNYIEELKKLNGG